MYLRRALLSLRKSVFHEREILVKICRKDSPSSQRCSCPLPCWRGSAECPSGAWRLG